MSETASAFLQQMREHIDRTQEILGRVDLDAVERVVDELFAAWDEGRRVFIFGNGGSAATASHLCEDLAKSTLKDLSGEKRLRVASLTDSVPFITALGNDCGFETVFREQLITLASPRDVVIAISGSGNSPNVVNATKWAAAHELVTVGLTGFNGGKLKGMVDISLHCPILDMEIAENCHMVISHLFVGGLRTRIAAAEEEAA